MAIAWGTAVLLLLLLPGFMAFTGLYATERFSRDTTPKSRTAQLAAIVFAAFMVHAALLLLLKIAAACGVECCDVSIATILQTILGPSGSAEGMSASRIARNIDQHLALIVLYVIVSVALGLGCGSLLGRTLQGPAQALLQHRWVYDLVPAKGKKTGAAPFAYVVTNASHDGRFLCYSGPLLDFSLDGDGRFTYLVLLGASRFYLDLTQESPMTGDAIAIGKTHDPKRAHDRDRLYLDGATIQNVVFDTFTFEMPAKLEDTLKLFDELVKKATRALAGGPLSG